MKEEEFIMHVLKEKTTKQRLGDLGKGGGRGGGDRQGVITNRVSKVQDVYLK